MDDTSCGAECPFVKMGFCKNCKECPNYMESWWQEQGDTLPKLIHDCSPKRLLHQQQYMQLRLEQLQAALDAQRAEYMNLTGQLGSLISITGNMLDIHHQLMEKQHERLSLPGRVLPDAS